MGVLLSSLDIVNQRFKKSMRGYDANEVDEFLDQVADTIQQYTEKNKEMERRIVKYKEDLEEYTKMQTALRETLMLAQKSAEEKVKNAEAEAERIIAEAKQNAEAICKDAAEESSRLAGNVTEIRSARVAFVNETRAMLAKFDTMLCDALSPSATEQAIEQYLPKQETEAAAEEAKPEGTELPEDFAAACRMLNIDPKEIGGE